MFFEERVAELMRKMLRKKLYVRALETRGAAGTSCKPFLLAHLEYMIGLEKRGLVFASGPLADGEGPPTGHGLTVLRAKDADEARALAEADPFFVNGLRTFELKEWTSWRARSACGSISPINRSKWHDSAAETEIHATINRRKAQGERSWRPSALSASARSACRSRKI